MKPLEALIHLGSLPVGGVLPAFEPDFGKDMGAFLSELSGLAVYPRSVVVLRGAVAFLGKEGLDKKLCVLSSAAVSPEFYRKVEGRARNVDVGGEAFGLKVADLTAGNAELVRKHIPFTAPGLVGLKTSVGLGDRLGLATPGHLRAVEGTGVAPYLAQQSIREMTRTERTAAQVMDCATWGVLEFGWRDGFGSDADHLKLPEDIDRTAAAGFTMFTVDPGDHVDSATDHDDDATLAAKYAALPWGELETTAGEC
ncbi:MAG TPA: tagaturonate epimerase family protein, partial [Candidatus Brocadiia bacterium]|nr:tagaturonate epimerase family protein [Candidatus Brocadiia bacterium]